MHDWVNNLKLWNRLEHQRGKKTVGSCSSNNMKVVLTKCCLLGVKRKKDMNPAVHQASDLSVLVFEVFSDWLPKSSRVAFNADQTGFSSLKKKIHLSIHLQQQVFQGSSNSPEQVCVCVWVCVYLNECVRACQSVKVHSLLHFHFHSPFSNSESTQAKSHQCWTKIELDGLAFPGL